LESLSWEVWTGRFGEGEKKDIVRIHEEEDGGWEMRGLRPKSAQEGIARERWISETMKM
jgi:hypothetical protein